MSDLVIPAVSTWADPTGAHRPSLDELGGGELLDDDDFPPPKDGSELFALLGNQVEYQAHAAARMIASAQITVDFTAGTPHFDRVKAANPALVAGDFFIDDLGLGVTRIGWLIGKLPAITTDPVASPNVLTNSVANAIVVASPTPGRVELTVATFTGGAAADIRFTVHIG